MASRRQPRNRPAPQQPASRVFSYYDSHSARTEKSQPSRQPGTKSRKIQAGDSRRWLRNLPALVAVIVVAGSVLYCLGLNTNPQVSVASLTDSSAIAPLRSTQEYQQGAQQILDQSVLNRTKFTINTSHFEQAFLKKFPEVADVSLSLPLISQKPVITIVEARPALLLSANNRLMVLDENGKVIMPASSLLPSVRQKLVTVTDQSGLSANPGQAVLASTDITYINSVLAQLQAKHLVVQSLGLPPQSQELDVHIAGQPYFVKFDFTTDATTAVGTYLAVKSSLDSQHLTPASYVDVRIDGRAYYK